jgi:hypothetical protein
MRALSLLLFTASLLSADGKGRVYLISLDGMGYHAFSEDPAATDLRYLRTLASKGVAAPMQAAFPSLTAPGHASIFTGVYGNQNGVTANQLPRQPRAHFTFTERANGFRAEQLQAETIWVTAGKLGIKAVANNPTQGYPCTAFNSGQNTMVANGYQAAELAKAKVVRASDVQWLATRPEGFVEPRATGLPPRYFEYTNGRIRFVGAIFARGIRYDAVRLTAYGGRRYVDATLRDLETLGPGALAKTRPLARYFSEGLVVQDLTAVHFRLFELSDDGREFLLYQSEAKELSICSEGPTQAVKFRSTLLHTTGGFVGNGAGWAYEKGDFGPVRTNGVAERRFLETLELHARQTMRHTRAMLNAFAPRLLVDYISTPDDMLHLWWGFAATGDKFLEPYRRWGYQIIDWRVRELGEILDPDDTLIVVSDHGMTAMTHEVRTNVLLKEWGYSGRVAAQDHYLVVNTTDWSEGTVPPGQTDALLAEVRQKLAAYRDTADIAVYREFFTPAEAAGRFGIGGATGGQLYFDLAEGYKARNDLNGPAVDRLDHPHGEHGPLPTRKDLLAVFVALGRGIDSRPLSLRTIDVAPLVLKILQAK